MNLIILETVAFFLLIITSGLSLVFSSILSSFIRKSSKVTNNDDYFPFFKNEDYINIQLVEGLINEDIKLVVMEDDDNDNDDILDDDEWLFLQDEYYQTALRRLKKEDETQWGLPENYTNTLYNCMQFNNNKIKQIEYKKKWKKPWSDDDKGYDLQDDTVDCLMDSWEWDVNLFDSEKMPKRCRGWNITPKNIRDDNDDYIEPCVLWHLSYGNFLPSAQPSISFSSVPSNSPTFDNPSFSPSNNPSTEPSSRLPSFSPSKVASKIPSFLPTDSPSKIQSMIPTSVPTEMWSSYPSSELPSTYPSLQASENPSNFPTLQTSFSPSKALPSFKPSKIPSIFPSLSVQPSLPEPSTTPSSTHTNKPTQSVSPTATVSVIPTNYPSTLPSIFPTVTPTIDWSIKPSRNLSPFILTLTFRLRGRDFKNLSHEKDDNGLTRQPADLQRLEITEKRVKDDKEIIREELLSYTALHLHAYMEQALGLEVFAVTSLESVVSEQGDTYWMEDIEGGVVHFDQNTAAPAGNALDILVQNAFLGMALDSFIAELQEKAISPLLQSTLYAEVVVESRLSEDFYKREKDNSNINLNKNGIWSTGFIMVVSAAGIACTSMVTLLVLLCTARDKSRKKFLSLSKGSMLSSSFSSSSELQEETESSINERQPTQRVTGLDYDSDSTSIYSYKQHDADDSVSLAPSFLHAINERTALGEYYNTDNSFDHQFNPDNIDPSTPIHSSILVPNHENEKLQFKKLQQKVEQQQDNYIGNIEDESSKISRKSIIFSSRKSSPEMLEEETFNKTILKTSTLSPLKKSMMDNEELNYTQEIRDIWAGEECYPKLFLHDLPETNISF